MKDCCKREIVRVLDELYEKRASFQSTILEYLDKYKPKPPYCEGMQEAIDKGAIYRSRRGYYFASLETRNGTLNLELERCPFCRDGENCIK
jgi:predicted ArsR family transcriptional regulator